MNIIRIKKGKDIAIAGVADKRVEQAAFPKMVAIKPPDFTGFKARVLVKEGTMVKVGTPTLEYKDDPRIRIVSPAGGKVIKVRRGEKRVILEIIIQTSQTQEFKQFPQYLTDETCQMPQKQVIEHLLMTGAWAFIRQRPFDHIANPEDKPKAIFVKAIDTNPLALDVDYALEVISKAVLKLSNN